MAPKRRTLPKELRQKLVAVKRPAGDSFSDAWIGLEPTFQTRRCIELYSELEHDENAYFTHPYMVGMVRAVGDDMAARYREVHARGESWTLFDDVLVDEGPDDWKILCKKLTFHMADAAEPFVLTLGMDPATFEMAMRPLPLAWLYDPRFVRFLQEIVFDVPAAHGLSASQLNGGGQFHISAKTLLTGSLLCDDVAYRLSHPELSTFMLDWPNCDDRSFRATKRRYDAFVDVIERYRAGAFHPKAAGPPTVETAYFDLWPDLPEEIPDGLMTQSGAPRGDARAVFQTNFAFGRAVKMRAQRVHPGYWQLQHPQDDGFRPDQIMRYSETNLARLQIIGELHVKKDVPLAEEGAFDLDAALEPRMLFPGASYELRAQESKASAHDYVDAVLLEVHSWRRLRANPCPAIRRTLLQDQLLVDGERTVKKHAGDATLDSLRRAARETNLKQSFGRVRSDFIEPETLFWAAWRALPARAREAIAREALLGFIERVEDAAAMDPRGSVVDPMAAHRHRVNPVLWDALDESPSTRRASDAVVREHRAFQAQRGALLAKRPVWSQIESDVPPWMTP